jgi:hypothetical protein
MLHGIVQEGHGVTELEILRLEIAEPLLETPGRAKFERDRDFNAADFHLEFHPNVNTDLRVYH